MSIIDTKYGKALKKEKPAAIHIPYACHLDENTVRLKSGHLLQVIRLEGVSFETAGKDALIALHKTRNDMLQGIADGRITVWTNLIRRQIHQFPTGDFDNDFCQDLNDRYKNHTLKGQKLFVNELYLTIIYKNHVQAPPLIRTVVETTKKAVGKTVVGLSQAARKRKTQAQIKALNDTVRSATKFLTRFEPRVLGTYDNGGQLYSEVLAFFGLLINGEYEPIPVARKPAADILTSHRLFFGKNTGEIRGIGHQQLFGAIGLQEYPAGTQYHRLDDLLRLPFAFVLSQSFSFVPRQESISAMQLTAKRMEQAGDLAESQIDEIYESLDDLQSNRMTMGNHHFNLIVYGDTQQQLDDNLATALPVIGGLGGKATREDMAMEPAFWAQLPGNFSYRPRVSMITNRNFAAFNTWHNFPSGQADNNHWGSAVTLFPTTSDTSYFLNFHVGKVGHTTIIGPSGSGKTVLMGFLSAQAQKFKPRMWIFDKDRGTEIFVRAQGGHYHAIQLGVPTGWNPLQLEETPKNKAFLKQWLKRLIGINGAKVTHRDTTEINAVVERLYGLPREERRLSTIYPMFDVTREEGVAARLTHWIAGGEHGWLFDNPADTFNKGASMAGFDMTELLDSPDVRTAAIQYLFHRMEEVIDGTPFIGFFDEGWKLLDDALFPPMMKDKYKTIRKKNGMLVFGSNNASDTTGTVTGKVIIDQSLTKIFMPNANATEEDYIVGWGLTEKEFDLVKTTLTPESRCFLIKKNNNSVVAKLDLDGLDDSIAVLSGEETTITLLDAIREETGDLPADWLPVFHERRLSNG